MRDSEGLNQRCGNRWYGCIDGSASVYGTNTALPAISTEFETLLAQGQEALEVTITSAFPLENDEIQILESKLKARYAGKSIRVETAVDQSLIGGFEIRSRVIL